MIRLANDDDGNYRGTFAVTVAALCADLLDDGAVPMRVTYDNGYADDRNPGTIDVTLVRLTRSPNGVFLVFRENYDEAAVPDLSVGLIHAIEVP